jgi:hypothetical protein
MTGMARRTGAVVVGIAAVAAAFAFAPAGNAQLPSCPPGTTNLLYCTTTGLQAPLSTTVRGTVLSANVCRAHARPLRVDETITSASGIRRVVVTLDGRRIKSQTSGRLRLTINTRRLKNTVHTLVIKVTDGAGRTTSRKFHFRLCAASRIPKFTG